MIERIIIETDFVEGYTYDETKFVTLLMSPPIYKFRFAHQEHMRAFVTKYDTSKAIIPYLISEDRKSMKDNPDWVHASFEILVKKLKG